MEIEFVGAAKTVTGSRHLLRTEHSTILLDCGLFQGRRNESNRRNRELGLPVRKIDAVVLSHAHIDHSGALPRLYRLGYRGPVYVTPATRDLCAAMLEDSAAIQKSDAEYINRHVARGDVPELEPVEALYDQEDVTGILSQMISVPYRRLERIAEGVELTFYDAGHVLGSSLVALDVDVRGDRRRLLFSGDLGRHDIPILKAPEVPDGVHALILESTYGDRVHGPIEDSDEELADVIRRTVERKGKVIIPSFALERAQEIVYTLKRLRDQGAIPKVPVFVDSPLTVRITDVFRMHPECFEDEVRYMMLNGESPFDFEGLRYVHSVEDSKAIDDSSEPSVIISASGMCEFGRVLHHLRATIEDRRNAIVIVGFQAEHTLGRRLVERRGRVRVFGVPREVHAEVVVLDGFSAHADRNALLSFAERLRERGPLRQIALVHGEPPAQEALRDALLEREFPSVIIPDAGDRMTI